MNNYYKYIIGILVVVLIGLLIWFFRSIVAFVVISAVLSFMGNPVVAFLGRVRIKRFVLPKALCAGITLALIWGICILFFWTFVPLIGMEANKLSSIDPDKILALVSEPVGRIDAFVNQSGIHETGQFSTVTLLREKIHSILSFSLITDVFGTVASTIGDIFIAAFSISFTTFFFLKDEKLFEQAIVLMVPLKHEAAVSDVLGSVKKLLTRYFVGISAQISGIIFLVAIGLIIVGIEFKVALVIALFAGVINVIPYVGPLIGMIVGLVLGITSKVTEIAPDHFVLLAGSILAVFLIVHLIDNVVFQPFIFSSSVKAHPLEIFLVLLLAGHMAGITGMLLAIPGYTVIRVIAKQFLNNFKVVKKLTEKI